MGIYKFVIHPAGGLPPARTLITNFVLYICMIFIYIYIDIYIYVCIHTYIYVYIYTHTRMYEGDEEELGNGE